jgi:hypothetical protein
MPTWPIQVEEFEGFVVEFDRNDVLQMARDREGPKAWLAEYLGISRWALERLLRREPLERCCANPDCGKPLPITATARRQFCDDYCRVTFHRAAKRRSSIAANTPGA